MALEWVACDAFTGVVLADLPDLEVPQYSATMMGYSSQQALLPIVDGDTPDNWLSATEPWATYIVLLDNEQPVWGAIVNSRPRNGTDDMQLGLVSIEAAFRRVFVGDETFAATDQCAIVESLVTTYMVDTVPITVEASASAITRDRTYTDDSDKTLYSVLTELASVIDGPEWAVRWVKGALGDQPTYRPVLYVADRLGTIPNVGLAPAVTLEFPGDVTAVEYVEDFSDGQFANDVLAVSTAIADIRPESAHFVDLATIRLRSEHRFTPSTSITDTATLDAHAEAALARMKNGTRSLTMTIDGTTAPAPGRDWNLGDTVGFVVSAPQFPGGLTGTARVTGWTRTDGPTPTLTPFLTDVEVD